MSGATERTLPCLTHGNKDKEEETGVSGCGQLQRDGKEPSGTPVEQLGIEHEVYIHSNYSNYICNYNVITFFFY